MRLKIATDMTNPHVARLSVVMAALNGAATHFSEPGFRYTALSEAKEHLEKLLAELPGDSRARLRVVQAIRGAEASIRATTIALAAALQTVVNALIAEILKIVSEEGSYAND